MLQPVDPGFGARHSDSLAYKAASSKWARDPLQYAAKAYYTARQELLVLQALSHSCIVPLIGMSISNKTQIHFRFRSIFLQLLTHERVCLKELAFEGRK